MANEAWEIAAKLDMVRLKQRLQANVHRGASEADRARPLSGEIPMPRYIIERNFAEQLGLTKDAVEGVNRINAEEGVESVSVPQR